MRVLSVYTLPTAKVLPGTGANDSEPAGVPSGSIGMALYGEGEAPQEGDQPDHLDSTLHRSNWSCTHTPQHKLVMSTQRLST